MKGVTGSGPGPAARETPARLGDVRAAMVALRAEGTYPTKALIRGRVGGTKREVRDAAAYVIGVEGFLMPPRARPKPRPRPGPQPHPLPDIEDRIAYHRERVAREWAALLAGRRKQGGADPS